MRKIMAAILLLLLFVAPVHAAKLEATIGVSDPAPNHGETIELAVSTNADTWILDVFCYQNDVLVYYAGGMVRRVPSFVESITLVSPSWLSGAASCDAQVRSFNAAGKDRVIAGGLTFQVSP